jgi:nitrogen fixation-related uncharacterized protein
LRSDFGKLSNLGWINKVGVDVARVVKLTALFICSILLCVIFATGTSSAQTSVVNPPPAWFDDEGYNGSHYYLRTFDENSPPYLHWAKPNLEKTTINNRVRLDSTGKVHFPWMRSDWSSLEDLYSKDPKVAPQISIVINSGSTSMKILRAEIWFDLDGLAKTEADIEAKAVFDPYLTQKTDTTEIVSLKASKIEGTLGNFTMGNIKLVLWRTDLQNETLLIYCGAFNSLSWIVVPFKFNRDISPPDNGDEDNKGLIIGAIVVLGILAVGIVIFLIWSSKSKNYDEEEEKVSISDSRRKKSQARKDREKNRDLKRRNKKR